MNNFKYDIFKDCNLVIDKEELIKQEFKQQLLRTLKMFEWKNLPKTIQNKDLELLLQLNGFAIFTKVNDNFYVFNGGLGGELNEYYLPTIAVVSNPYLKYNKTLKINEDCIVILNDDLYEGLTPLFKKYSTLIAEALISIKWSMINARIPYLIDADNDQTKQDATDFMNKIIRGESIGIIGHQELFDGIKTYEYSSKTTHLRDLLETLQYLKASWYNEIGLQSNFNMKREALNSSETSLNEDVLIPSIDKMLECRKNACKLINDMYGLNIDVKLSTTWKQLRKEMENNIKLQESEIKDNEENKTKTDS